MLLALISAIHHRRAWLVPAAAFSMLYVLLASAIWVMHGLAGLFTGREPVRDKPTRCRHAQPCGALCASVPAAASATGPICRARYRSAAIA
ncbi:hypothetical protein G6F58_013501 [Rhizopus delemar]|nr:hypothetical protein G6F58_013501 [Rhizopus delemar]